MNLNTIAAAAGSTQSQVQTAISVKVLKLAQQHEQQRAQLIEQVIDTAQAVQDGNIDVYA